MKKHENANIELSQENIETCAKRQNSILDSAVSALKENGILVYSTCTLLPEENQDVTEEFLARHIDFQREAFTLPLPVGPSSGHLTLWPQRLGTDGFYICRMRRK